MLDLIVRFDFGVFISCRELDRSPMDFSPLHRRLLTELLMRKNVRNIEVLPIIALEIEPNSRRVEPRIDRLVHGELDTEPERQVVIGIHGWEEADTEN